MMLVAYIANVVLLIAAWIRIDADDESTSALYALAIFED